MSAGGGEFVTTDEPTVGSEPFLDAMMVEDGQSDGGFAYPPWADESEWGQAFCKTNDSLDQGIASETCPRRWRRRLSERAGCKYKTLGPLVVGDADLV